jgi:hypothetical protein
MQSRSGPGVEWRLHPLRIVKSPSGNGSCAREVLPLSMHGSPTVVAKLQFEPAIAFVRATFIGLEYTAGYLDGSFVEVRRHHEGSPGHSLASVQ